MDNTYNKYYSINKERWEDLAEHYSKGKYHKYEEFKNGGLSLHFVEREDLGDVKEKKLLHLQCNFGLDTLSWARLGADVTGVDFSSKAIEAGRGLAKKYNISARFVESQLYELPNTLDEPNQFDIVFTSYGVLSWLHDLPNWAKIISHFLKPGGEFYIVESHPISWIFDDKESYLNMIYDYFPVNGSPIEFNDDDYNYSEPDKVSHKIEYSWAHTLSDVINSLIGAGLTITQVKEYPFATWKILPYCVNGTNPDIWTLPDKSHRKIPLMFSIKAKKE